MLPADGAFLLPSDGPTPICCWVFCTMRMSPPHSTFDMAVNGPPGLWRGQYVPGRPLLVVGSSAISKCTNIHNQLCCVGPASYNCYCLILIVACLFFSFFPGQGILFWPDSLGILLRGSVATEKPFCLGNLQDCLKSAF